MNKDLGWLLLEERQLLALVRTHLNPPLEGGELDPCLAVCKVDWAKLYALAEKHSVVGLCWGGIEKLPKEKLPDMDWLMEWLGQAEYIKNQNEVVDKAVETVVSKFADAGLEGIVLKGQGLAQLYPQPKLRTSGDIDILIGDCNPSEELISRICKMAIANGTKNLHATYHHCDFGKVCVVEVEAHWRASWFHCPWYNKRFQQFSQEHINDTEGIYPSLAFNRVYNLVHIYRHLFSTGIGLRQLIDYYMVLRASAADFHSTSSGQAFWPQQKIETMQRLKELHLEKFASAVMWIMKYPLGASDDMLLCKPCEKDGKFLLGEVMKAGNFGHSVKGYSRGKNDSLLRHTLRKLRRNIKLFRFGEWEVICTPFWRLWHVCYWMPRHNTLELSKHN